MDGGLTSQHSSLEQQTLGSSPSGAVAPEQVRVVAAPHPFRTDRVDIAVAAGPTLAEMLDAVQPDPILRAHAHIFIGDQRIARDYWRVVRPKPGATITVRVVPQGGGGGGKNPLRTILTIAVVAAGFALAGPLGSALVGSAGIALGGATISAYSIGAMIIGVGGMLLVNAIAPVRPPKMGDLSGTTSEDSPTLFIEGARNAARPFGAVPIVLGRHRMVPPLGAQSFTEKIGPDQAIRMLAVWGYGPCALEDPRIGETPLEAFEGVQVEHRGGHPGEAPLSLYPSRVIQEDLSIILRQADDWQTRVSAPGADELSVDITFPRGLTHYTDAGKRGVRHVGVQIQYRKTGDSEWLWPVFSHATVPADWISPTGVQFSHAYSVAMLHGFRWAVAERGQYEVRLRRVTADTDDPQIIDETAWTALRAITAEDPIQFPHPLAKTALVIKATEQLNRSVDELNCIVTSQGPVWTGSGWVQAPTSNPASLFRIVLQGAANASPLPDSRLDLDGLADWYVFCEQNDFEFNMVRDFQASVYETLADIAAAGRASVSQSADGKWGVVIDRPQLAPVQHFTPRNSWGFEAEKALPDVPHGFRIRFPNRNQGWRQEERIVYDDGFTAGNATRFEQLDGIGITDPDHIWKFGRFHIAQARLRPERWNFNADFEHIVCRRGDLIRLTHDVLLVGLASARIVSLVTDGGGDVTAITVDEALPMEAGKQYGVSIRTLADPGLTRQVVTAAGEQHTVAFATPIAAAQAPAAGDLLGFGELGLETIDGLLLAIEPQGELTARLTAIPYSPAVYDADTGDIPPFDSRLTPPTPIPDVIIRSVRSDESALTLGSGDTILARIAVKVEPSGLRDAMLEIQIRRSDAGEPFREATIVARTDDSAILGEVEEGEFYDLRLRWNDPARLPGRWSEVAGHKVIGQSSPPEAPQGLTISVFGGSALLRWNRPPELDVRFGGEIRFRHSPAPDAAQAEWNESVSIGQAAKSSALLAQLPLKPGTYLARAFDRGGRPSVEVAKISTKQASVLGFAAVDEVIEDPGFTGGHDDTVASDGVLRLVSDALFDDIPDFDAVPRLDSLGQIVPEGVYGFAAGLDLGSVSRVRLTSAVDAVSISEFDLMDGWSGLVDDRENWDGTEQAETDARVQVRQTDDDPAGSPVWGPWNDLDSGEFEARGFEFRARLSSANPAFNIHVNELRVRAEELA